MAHAGTQRFRRLHAKSASPPHEGAWRRLTAIAFFLILILVIVRMTIQETLRPDSSPTPGAASASALPGPDVSLALDLLCCVPALLVLARRVADRRFSIRMTWSHAVMLGLAIWTLASIAWSGDKFAAMIASADWAAALVLLWTASQLVRSWRAFRIVAAAGFGLLLVLLTQGYYYRLVDLPDFQQSWRSDKAALLREGGMAVNPVEAEQLGKNVLAGEPTGFNVSRNTYAAVLVLLLLCAAGIVLQRMTDKDRWGWSAPVLLAIALALFMLYRFVQSKTAFATPLAGFALIALLYRRRQWLSSHARQTYWASVGAFLLAAAAVVGHGLAHGTLGFISLTFRWWYWIGAARVFAHHPWVGVGWANFGQHYLAHRLPQAAEEPRDPHNFLVRAFVELGVVGGALMVAWMLRLWWELTVPPVTASDGKPSTPGDGAAHDAGGKSPVPFLVGVAMIAITLNSLISIDWSIGWAWAIQEAFKRLLFFMALVVGLSFVAIRSFDRQELDPRPARWMLAGSLAALGLFLVHNLIDFSLFETGPMFLFALLAGAALGARAPMREPQAKGRVMAASALGVCAIGGALILGGVWYPLHQAECLARGSDLLILGSKPTGAPRSMPPNASRIDAAADRLAQAFGLEPFNGDYAFRAEQTLLLASADRHRMQRLLDGAVAADPYSIRYRAARAVLEAATGNVARADADYQRILALDPDDLSLRLQYARWLDARGRREEARVQYEKTLELNAKLAADEIRRLPKELVSQVRARLAKP